MPRPSASLRRRLLSWYDSNARDLPWRRTRDPYRIWVSEIMLQQTQVATVVPYYRRFLARFPTLKTLAAAPEAEVLKRWAGLGYYSRARNLRLAAQAVMSAGGKLPSEPAALESLPGIGRYTAGAIASIAFSKPAPLVDGNVIRVLSRLFGVSGDLSTGSGQERIWELSARIVDTARPGDWNQALMELGATTCTPAAPRCGACPVARHCAARAAGTPTAFPDLGARQKSVAVKLACAVASDGESLIIERRPEAARLLGGHWGLPMIELPRGASADAAFSSAYPSLRLTALAGRVSHSITHHRISLEVWKADASRVRLPLKRIALNQLDRFVVSSLFQKALREAGDEVAASKERARAPRV